MSERHILLSNVFFAPFTYGGATIVAEQVARELRAQTGWRISAISAAQRGDMAPYTIAKSEVDGIANYIINLPPGRYYSDLYDNSRVTEIIAGLMDALAPDLLHAHCVQDLGAGMFEAAQDRGIPVILSVHDFWWICDRQFMIRPNQKYCGQHPVKIDACRSCVDDFSRAKTRFSRLARLAQIPARVTYPSQFALELSEASGFATGRGVVWSNGVRLPEPGFFEAQAARRARDPQVSFGFVGGPSQIKGWPIIRKAIGALDRDDFRLLLVDGSPDGSWWRDVDLAALPGDIRIHPRFEQENMDSFYKEIDVLLFMSQWKETFGLAIREALARGIRVIQTDSGGTVEHGAMASGQAIDIGAPASVLEVQLRAALSRSDQGQPPLPVASFTDQARAFAVLIDELLAPR
ncbi:MAG: glycosyltransferase [Paracoccaceae bacterium]|nr:glycosyltransferase [Paracoccaceae bacterium]